jgi:hypothetical protein
MNHRYRDVLDYGIGARLVVEFVTDRNIVVDYAVILTVDVESRAATVRVYDGAHGLNDMHRHNSRGEKSQAERFHAGTLGEGMRAAIIAVRTDYKEMIAGWRTT